MKDEIVFQFENYLLPCSYAGCKNNSDVTYNANDIEIHLCKKHFEEEVKALKEKNIKTNFEKIDNYLTKIEKQRNRKNSCLKLSSYND